LYDVHAMPWALEAVLAEVDADAIVFGGDLVGGPYPRETLELARSVDATFVRGNAERELTDWDRLQLAGDDIAWLAELPLSAHVDGVLYCHATPHDDMPITTAITPDDAIAAAFGSDGTVVIGHTHHQFDRRVGGLRIVNAGSVGMPYEGEVAAFWLLVEDGEPHFRRTPIDIERAAHAILESGWPGASEFVAENVRAAVSRDEAVRYFESTR
jgi:diadenosine tetraphosphatase ApaH/serine/threonine PP2A family protein phosphatase